MRDSVLIVSCAGMSAAHVPWTPVVDARGCAWVQRSCDLVYYHLRPHECSGCMGAAVVDAREGVFYHLCQQGCSGCGCA